MKFSLRFFMFLWVRPHLVVLLEGFETLLGQWSTTFPVVAVNTDCSYCVCVWGGFSVIFSWCLPWNGVKSPDVLWCLLVHLNRFHSSAPSSHSQFGFSAFSLRHSEIKKQRYLWKSDLLCELFFSVAREAEQVRITQV